MSLAEMAAKAAQTGGKLVCPRCNCVDFRTYGTIPGHASTFRYKQCRNCGYKAVTNQEPERIIRSVESPDNVTPEEDQIEGDLL